MSKLNSQAMARRDRVETGMIRATAAQRRLSLVVLRCRQAIQRSPLLTDLLAPALEDLAEVEQEIVEMQQALRGVWEEGEQRRWEVEA